MPLVTPDENGFYPIPGLTEVLEKQKRGNNHSPIYILISNSGVLLF